MSYASSSGSVPSPAVCSLTDPDLSSTSVLPLPTKPLRYIPTTDAFVTEVGEKASSGLVSVPRVFVSVRRRSSPNSPMHWPAALSTFVLNRMAELVKDGLDIDRGIRDASLDKICKDVLIFCNAKVSNTQLYNHLRKWKTRWNHLRILAQAEGVVWREESSTFFIDDAAFLKHVHPKDECFINTSIENYEQMKTIFTKPRVLNHVAVNTLHLALSYLMDHEEERVAYLAGNEETRKKWYYSYYRALFVVIRS